MAGTASLSTKRCVPVLLTALLLMLPGVACVSSPSERGYSGWIRSGGGGTEAEFEEDRRVCRAATEEAVWIRAGAGARQMVFVNEEDFVACMNGRGWYRDVG